MVPYAGIFLPLLFDLVVEGVYHRAEQIERLLLDFRGSDTHGLKAFRRDRVAPIAEACVTDKDVYASELVIRAYRAGIAIDEIPLRVVEKRPPSINLFKRVPNVLKNLGRLTWAIHRNG